LSKIIDTDTDVAADTLNGAAEIAAFLGKNRRQAFWLCQNKQIPSFKVGGLWRMRKSAYRRFIERREAQ
jgi:hypothetical protein